MDAGKRVFSAESAGTIRADAVTSAGQLVIFEPEGPEPRVDILIRLPFDLRELIDRPVRGRLHAAYSFDAMDPDRTLLLNPEGGPLIQVIQRGGTEPAVLGLDDDPGGLEERGLVVRQGGAGSSAPKPSHDYTYPVPVEIRVPDGTVTSIWQGEWLELGHDQEGRAVHVFVLVSEVAKPRGNAVQVFEGTPFDLQLLVLTWTP